MKNLLLYITLIFCNLSPVTAAEHGKASFYSTSCNGGTRTASGQKLRNDAMTAAHRTLPFGTVVKVTNKRNGKSVECKITDRGPYVKGRIIDVTVGVADKLGFRKNGITSVEVEILSKPKR